MYAITGITGKVGSAMGEALLGDGLPVRAIVRDAAKARRWADRGCEVAVATMVDAAALTAAFAGAGGVFILPPSDFDPAPGYPAARRVIDAVRAAIAAARPGRVLCLSTIGGDAQQDNLLTQRTLMEQAITPLPVPVTVLRPAWFLDNAAWDVGSARTEGVVRSFLMPLDKPFPMVAAADVGRTAALLIRERWTGVRIVCLEGPRRVSPDDLARSFAKALGRPVHAEIVPRDRWERLFLDQGMRHPGPRMRMLDGLNEGWIGFPAGDPAILHGETEPDALIAELVGATSGIVA